MNRNTVEVWEGGRMMFQMHPDGAITGRPRTF